MVQYKTVVKSTGLMWCAGKISKGLKRIAADNLIPLDIIHSNISQNTYVPILSIECILEQATSSKFEFFSLVINDEEDEDEDDDEEEEEAEEEEEEEGGM